MNIEADLKEAMSLTDSSNGINKEKPTTGTPSFPVCKNLPLDELDAAERQKVHDVTNLYEGYNEGAAQNQKAGDVTRCGTENSFSYRNVQFIHHETRNFTPGVVSLSQRETSSTFQLPDFNRKQVDKSSELPKHLNKVIAENSINCTKDIDLCRSSDPASLLMTSIKEDSGKSIISLEIPNSFCNLGSDAEDIETQKKQFESLNHNYKSKVQELNQKEEENMRLLHEISRIREKDLRLEKECERLRVHLLDMEDRYTRDAVEAEEREEQLRKSLASLEGEMASSNTDVLNAKSTAAKQTDSLRNQLHSMTEQRDNALQRLAAAQETISGYSSSLANLQMVLEQFQDETRQQQTVELEKCRRDLDKECLINEQLRTETSSLQLKLDELSSTVGMMQQLEKQFEETKSHVTVLQNKVCEQEGQLLEAKANMDKHSAVSEDKIDRHLAKNLLMGFIHTPPAKRSEAFRVVGHILGFTDEELQSIGVNTTGGWLNGFFQQHAFAANSVLTDKAKAVDQSFFELFVRFLEKESSPLPEAKLPMDRMVKEQQEKQQKTFLRFDTPLSPPSSTVNFDPFHSTQHSASSPQVLPPLDACINSSFSASNGELFITSVFPEAETQRLEFTHSNNTDDFGMNVNRT